MKIWVKPKPGSLAIGNDVTGMLNCGCVIHICNEGAFVETCSDPLCSLVHLEACQAMVQEGGGLEGGSVHTSEPPPVVH